MKSKLIIPLMALTLFIIPVIVLADPWSAINSGYGVTTNHHGEEIVPPGDPPLAAKVGLLTEKFLFENGTTRLINVTVDLRDPYENVVDTQTVYPEDFGPGTSPNGQDMNFTWTDPFEPDTWTVGHYSVKAYFYLKGGQGLANAEDLDAMRATTVMSVPEAPIGTLTILLTMIAGLAIFARKRL